jgi:hypothetical protein
MENFFFLEKGGGTIHRKGAVARDIRYNISMLRLWGIIFFFIKKIAICHDYMNTCYILRECVE